MMLFLMMYANNLILIKFSEHFALFKVRLHFLTFEVVASLVMAAYYDIVYVGNSTLQIFIGDKHAMVHCVLYRVVLVVFWTFKHSDIHVRWWGKLIWLFILLKHVQEDLPNASGFILAILQCVRVYVLIIDICRIGFGFLYSFRSVIGYFIWGFCLKIFQGWWNVFFSWVVRKISLCERKFKWMKVFEALIFNHAISFNPSELCCRNL